MAARGGMSDLNDKDTDYRRNIALILSGGTGRRLGTDIPKQYLEAGGRSVISYCIETLSLSLIHI